MPDKNSITPLEKQKLALEQRKLDSEIELRKLELEAKARENGWLAKLFSPLTVGVLALAGSAVGALFQADSNLALERTKSAATQKLETQKEQHELILKMVSVAEVEQAKQNIQFLAETGLIADETLANKILTSKVIPRIPPQNSPSVLVGPPGCEIPVNPGQSPGLAMQEWAKMNLEEVHVPQLAKIASGPKNGNILFNPLAAEALKSAWAEIEENGLLDRVVTWDGAYVARFDVNNPGRLSAHACGLAFDINASFNPNGNPPTEKGKRGSVVELAPILKRHGFSWQGDLKGRPNAMHFEYVILQSEIHSKKESKNKEE